MSYWEQEIELMARTDLEDFQVTRLQRTISRAMHAPYYHRVFKESGLSPESIQSIDDIVRFPFTSKEDLRSGRPDDFLAVPHEQVVRLHASSGTTGTPTAIYHTGSDLDNWANLVARCLCMAGFTSSDVFQNIVGYGLFTGGLGLHYGAEKLGATVIPAGVGNTRRQVHLMKLFGTTSLHIIPSYALKLLDTLTGWGIDPKTDLKLQRAVIGAEPHTDGARCRIEEGFGISAFNCYGLSEMNGPGVAFECPEKSGLHLWEDSYILEIVDPESLEVLPDGEVGEIVLTTLNREAMPLIRYRTRDLAYVYPDPCPCGRTHRRLSRIRGRADDMLILKGVNIFPMQVERILMSEPEVGGNYVIVLDREGPVDIMTVRAEMSDALTTAGNDTLNKTMQKLVRLLRDELLISPRVELVPPGELESGPGKAIRVVDNRPPEDVFC